MPEITFTLTSNGIGQLTVDRPQVRNALNWAAMQSFAESVAQAHTSPDLRALIVTGANGAFISGGDLSELRAHPSKADGAQLARIMGDALLHLSALPCPVIAAITGPARGGGAEVAMACDLRVMDAETSLAFVQAKLGLIPGWGGGQRLLQVAGYATALDLLATGRVVSAAEAYALRLVQRVAPTGTALTVAQELAATISTNPPDAVRAVKRVLQTGLQIPTAEALAYERAEFPALWASEFRQAAVEKFLGKPS